MRPSIEGERYSHSRWLMRERRKEFESRMHLERYKREGIMVFPEGVIAPTSSPIEKPVETPVFVDSSVRVDTIYQEVKMRISALSAVGARP